MRKSLSQIASDRKKKQAAPAADAPTEVLGKKILDPKVNPCSPEAGFDKFTPFKNLYVNITRFSSGSAGFFYDLIDSQFIEAFVKDINGDWAAFAGSGDVKALLDDAKMQEGFVKNKWANKTGVTAQDFIKVYSQLESDTALTFKDFAFMNIEFQSKRATQPIKCDNCLKTVRPLIIDFFNYLDCEQTGYLSSTNIYKGIKNMKTTFPVRTTMVNDFVIKAMETNTATLDIKDFTYGILMGMMERLISADNLIPDPQCEVMRAARKAAVEAGNGPKRR